jgi:hypothetical protein
MAAAEPDPEDANPSLMRPRDLALLLLATSHEPPRARARDQQADRAGGALRRRVLDRLLEDPEPEVLEVALAAIVAAFGEPSGPTRGVCSMFRQEWAESRLAPGYWTWLLSEAVARGDGERGPRRRRSDGPEPAP